MEAVFSILIPSWCAEWDFFVCYDSYYNYFNDNSHQDNNCCDEQPNSPSVYAVYCYRAILGIIIIKVSPCIKRSARVSFSITHLLVSNINIEIWWFSLCLSQYV